MEIQDREKREKRHSPRPARLWIDRSLSYCASIEDTHTPASLITSTAYSYYSGRYLPLLNAAAVNY